MPLLEVVLKSPNMESLEVDKFMAYSMSLVKQKGVICQFKSSGVVIEGDKKTLLEILNEIKTSSFQIKTKQIKANTILNALNQV